MEAKELRIGNIVECYINGQLKNGSHIVDADDIKISQSNDWYVLKPIQLTEEWLLKFGFENNDGWHYKNGIELFGIRDLYFRGNFPIKADIKYVHQLQNLYFALTGEELVLTEK